jgi:hypothetical protein
VYLAKLVLVYLEHDWCIWNMIGVFGTWLVYLEQSWCIWNMVGVFGTWLVYLETDLGYLENL